MKSDGGCHPAQKKKKGLSSIIRVKIEIRKLQEARLFDNYSHVRKNILVSELNIPNF